MHLFGSDFNRSLVVSSSGDKMTPSPVEMRTTPKRAKSQTKADDDADKEQLPQRHRSREHQQVPTAATPTRATNLRSRLRAWVDDAETERLPSRHRIRPRERLPAKKIVQENIISDTENISTSSPLLRRGLRKGGHNQY